MSNLLETALQLAPAVIDLFVALPYLTHLFDISLAFIALATGIAYVWVGVAFMTWSQRDLQKWVEKSLAENKVVTESMANWQSISYFNMAKFELGR